MKNFPDESQGFFYVKGLTFFFTNDIVNSYEKIRQKHTNKNFKNNINNDMDDNNIYVFRTTGY